MNKVTVVGSYIVALTMDTERLPVEGETVHGHNYQTTHGGKGSNVVVSAARLGADAAFIGKIGRDIFGEQFLSLLATEGVSNAGVMYSNTKATAAGFIVTDARGRNAIVIDMGPNGELTPEDLTAHTELIRRSDVILSPLEIPLATALAAARIAKGYAVKAILNPAPATDLRGQDLSCCFALTPNETEARVCLGLPPNAEIPDWELARSLLDLGCENVMLTRGAAGAIWASRDGIESFSVPDVHVLDTVGAGDAFNAGLAVGISEGKALREAIALGVAAASLSTEKRQTIASYPKRGAVTPYLQQVLNRIRPIPETVRASS
ncbi:MAG TPA: ribokinase [Candidatus Sulfotelmatobacter sp.]|nr:ribokinase [Candidatus Sulfotelmatobacter sp.]